MHVEYAIFGLGSGEMIAIIVLALLLFGGKKIPELMKGMGQGVREFNAAKSSIKQEIEEGMKEKPVVRETTTTTTEEKKA